MTDEQKNVIEDNLRRGIPFSLSLYRAVCGDNVDIVADYMEGRIPEPWKSEVRERLDRVAILGWQLCKIQAQLDRIEAKLSQ